MTCNGGREAKEATVVTKKTDEEKWEESEFKGHQLIDLRSLKFLSGYVCVGEGKWISSLTIDTYLQLIQAAHGRKVELFK